MTTAAPINLVDLIRDIPDFPKPGILFRDITPLLQCPAAFRETIRQLAEPFRGQGIELIAAAEARGFIFAAPLALELNAGLIPIRKPGKLPGKTLSHTYDLEYGTDTLQVHADAIIRPGCKVLMVERSAGHRRYDRRLLHDDRTGRWCGGGLRLRDRVWLRCKAGIGSPSTRPSV